MVKIINDRIWRQLAFKFTSATPFNHVVIDDFFDDSIAWKIANEMPDYDTGFTGIYDNAIEKKRTMQNWSNFSKNTYKAMSYLSSQDFIDKIEQVTNIKGLVADIGLHGGGIHMHKRDDYLNTHLDYDIHPKLDMRRKLNIIIYMTPFWHESWGGHLELFSNDITTNQPVVDEYYKKILPKFNRAVVFDTTQNSWHGVTAGITPPEGIYRQSLALYYLIETEDKENKRQRALFSPREEQKNDSEILSLIHRRSVY